MEVLLFLIVAVLITVLSAKLKVSSVLFYLVAGAIMGPNALSIISNGEIVENAAHLGVVSLLFTIGLQLPLERFKALKTYAFGLGSLQVIFCTAIYGFLLSFFKGFSFYEVLFIGFTISLSSTAVVAQLLNDRGDLATQYGKAGFAILLFQDLAVVLALALIPIASGGGQFSVTQGVIAVTKALFVLGLLLSVGGTLLRPVYKLASSYGSETFMATTIIIILGGASATLFIGLSMELGAFLTGMLLAGTEYRHQIEADIRPFKGLLLGLFFITVGMSTDLMILLDYYPSVIKALGSILLIKFTIIFFLCRIFGLMKSSSIKVAALLCTGGEFAFIFTMSAMKAGIVNPDIKQVLCLAISISMALTPLLSLLARFLGDIFDKNKSTTSIQSVANSEENLEDHIIIAGFGTVGQTIATAIAQHLIPFVAIDHNMSRVSAARAKGLPVFFGDARRSEVFNILHVRNAKLVVVTLDDYSISARTAIMLLRNFPKLNVWIRSQGTERVKSLRQSGVNVVVPEILQPSLQLAEAVLSAAKISAEDIKQTISEYLEKNDFKGTISLEQDEPADS